MFIAVFRFLWLQMLYRFIQAVRRPDLRLGYCLPGPVLLIAGWTLVFMRATPALALGLIIAGSGLMRAQASMVEDNPSQALRNGAVLIGVWAGFWAVVQEWTWVPVLVALAAVLFGLHRYHHKVDRRVRHRSKVGAANDAARRALGGQ